MKKLHRENIVACMIFSVILHGVALYRIKTSEESEVRRPFTDSTHFAVVRNFEAVFYDDAIEENASSEALPQEKQTAPAFPSLKKTTVAKSKRMKEKSEAKAPVDSDAIGAPVAADLGVGDAISVGEGSDESAEGTTKAVTATGNGDNVAASAPAPARIDIDAIWEAYAEEIKRILMTGKRYPAAAKAMQIEGLVILYVKINRNGDVLGIDIAESSGYAVLDNAARQSVQKKSPLPPFPSEIRVSERILKIPFRYTLRKG